MDPSERAQSCRGALRSPGSNRPLHLRLRLAVREADRRGTAPDKIKCVPNGTNRVPSGSRLDACDPDPQARDRCSDAARGHPAVVRADARGAGQSRSIPNARSTPRPAAAFAAAYGLDKPLPEQAARYLGGVLTGDFGPSLVYKDFTVGALIGQGLAGVARAWRPCPAAGAWRSASAPRPWPGRMPAAWPTARS